jgi:RNA polymerase sigma-70 factor (ECF subfamily)
METTLQALAYTIARNLLNDLYRRKQWAVRHGMQPIDCKQQPVTSDDETARPLSVQEVTEFLERGLLRVPEKCRELYRMHIYDGMQVSDISQQTGENYKSVEYRLGVARKEIRKYLRHIS